MHIYICIYIYKYFFFLYQHLEEDKTIIQFKKQTKRNILTRVYSFIINKI